MGINLYWDNEEQSVILCEFEGKWTWDELHKVLHTTRKLSLEQGRIFGAIVDIRKSSGIPGGNLFSPDTLNNFKKLMQIGADGKGPAVVVGMSGAIKGVVDAIKIVDRNVLDDVYFEQNMTVARRTIYGVMIERSEQSA
ncbi:MAG: hypothetical protein ACPG7F_07855 [Aggregatilineales bacterium]